MQDVVLCCGKMISDKCDTAAYMSVLLLENVKANRIIMIELVGTYTQSLFIKLI